MKTKYFFISLIFFLTIIKAQERNMNNPFFKVWDTPFNTPPFSQIKTDDFLPAFEEGMKQHKEEILKIIDNKETPNFQNTIVELEKSGESLTKVANVFYNLNNTITNDEMQKINQIIAPKLAKHNDDIKLNEKLFEKIKSVYLQKDELNLTSEEKLLLGNYYSDFIRGGVNLTGEQKERFRKINEELSLLTVKFGENILKETNSIGLVIENKDDLIGLSETVIQGAFETAKSKGLDGKWAFTLQRASWTPFLQYSPKRELREKLFKAYINRGNNNNEFDTKNILRKIASLRIERANLLGFKTHADFKLEKNMAKNPENVFKFLNDLWIPAIKKAKAEANEMQNLIYKEGNNFKLQPWDW